MNTPQIPPLDQSVVAPESHDGLHEVASDIAYQRIILVNVVYYGLPNAPDRQWVLIDAGVMSPQKTIIDTAAKRFGPGSRPAAIILTHGHFDHTGALADLAELWDAPIYAHPFEHPYLDGR